MTALAIVGLAWAVVALVAIGACVWSFNAWRHPSLDQNRLQSLESSMADVGERLGKLELGASWPPHERAMQKARR